MILEALRRTDSTADLVVESNRSRKGDTGLRHSRRLLERILKQRYRRSPTARKVRINASAKGNQEIIHGT